MKRKLTVLLILAMTVSMVACSQSNTTEVETITEIEANQTIDYIEPSKTEVPPEVAKTRELITIDLDLSIFGELVDTLYTISNDVEKITTKDEAFEYLKNKGYSFYPYADADIDNTITTEEAYNNFSGFDMKPDFILENCKDSKYSHASVVSNDNGTVDIIQYKYRGVTEEFVNNERTKINEFVDSGILDGYNIKVVHNKDKDTWSQFHIYFYGEPVEHPSAEYFAEIYVNLDTYSSLYTFSLY